MGTPRKPGSMYGWSWRQKLEAVVPRGDVFECWSVSDKLRRDPDGYVHMASNDTTEVLVHRLAVLADGRAIPPGYEVDHLCLTRDCANPLHLEVVSKEEHMRRRRTSLLSACRRGHDRSNFYPYGGCRICKAEYEQARRLGKEWDDQRRRRTS